jgi:hypothetical protein
LTNIRLLSNRSVNNLPKSNPNPSYDNISEETLSKFRDKIVNIDRESLKDYGLGSTSGNVKYDFKDSRVSSVQSVR